MSEGVSNMDTAKSPVPPAEPATAKKSDATPLLEARSVSKYFGSVNALEDITLAVNSGEVTCVLGDNGAGKSTLIKILSGVHTPDKGELLVEGEPVSFSGPRDARARGIATVFQDLATVPLMSVWRNFFLGNEPTRGRGVLQRLDVKGAQKIMREELAKMGIDVRDPNQTVGTLSGGERQAVAIARAVYFGAKVLILDEPTSALGVRQSGIVLKYVIQARALGRGVIFITHNPHHAFPVGDRFVLLKRGRMLGSYAKADTSLEQLTALMAGGAELEQLSHELAQVVAADPELREVAKELAAEARSTA
jgi:simple sugar transport system ATP-binding protein